MFFQFSILKNVYMNRLNVTVKNGQHIHVAVTDEMNVDSRDSISSRIEDWVHCMASGWNQKLVILKGRHSVIAGTVS